MINLQDYNYYINGELVKIPWLHDLYMMKDAMCSKDRKLTLRKVGKDIFINIFEIKQDNI